jgi:putative phosphoribosyl transferase
MVFQNRRDAGRKLAALLTAYAGRPDVLVLALPRGGVPVGFEVAKALRAPLDVFVVRKLGAPGTPELALGAIATGDACVRNEDIIRELEISEETIATIAAREKQELERREQLYRGKRPAPRLQGRTLLLVDDGLATGSTMRAAIAAVRQQNPARVVVAVPVGTSATCEELRREADEVVCVQTPQPFYAVGLWYLDFSQTSDREVRDLLRAARPEQEPAG